MKKVDKPSSIRYNLSTQVVSSREAISIEASVLLFVILVVTLDFFSGYRNGFLDASTVRWRIYPLGSVYAFRARTSYREGLLAAAFFGGPVSNTHVVSSSIMGGGAGQRISAVFWGVAKHIVVAWLITIPASAAMAGLSFFLICRIHPKC